jgi:hypothetical protein
MISRTIDNRRNVTRVIPAALRFVITTLVVYEYAHLSIYFHFCVKHIRQRHVTPRDIIRDLISIAAIRTRVCKRSADRHGSADKCEAGEARAIQTRLNCKRVTLPGNHGSSRIHLFAFVLLSLRAHGSATMSTWRGMNSGIHQRAASSKLTRRWEMHSPVVTRSIVRLPASI